MDPISAACLPACGFANCPLGDRTRVSEFRRCPDVLRAKGHTDPRQQWRLPPVGSLIPLLIPYKGAKCFIINIRICKVEKSMRPKTAPTICSRLDTRAFA